MIDISGTQFIRPTPIAPISIEPMRTACAVSRSLPICAFGKDLDRDLAAGLVLDRFLEMLGPEVPAVRGRRGMREADALDGSCARALVASNGDSEASAEAPAKRSTRGATRMRVASVRWLRPGQRWMKAWQSSWE